MDIKYVNNPLLKNISNDNIQIDINDYDKQSVIKLQKIIRSFNHKNKFKQKIKEIIHSPDTVRITPGKFKIPLYLVQKTLCTRICSKKIWKNTSNFIENNLCMFFFVLLWITSLFFTNIYFFNFYNQNIVLILSVCSSLPLYLLLYGSLQDQLLTLVFSSMECKIHTILNIALACSLTDLFRDYRIITVWGCIFPGLLIIPFADAIPRYLIKGRRIFMFMLFIFLIYLYSIIFGIAFGWIEVVPRELIIYSKNARKNVNNTKLVTYSSVSNSISLIQTVIALILKNLLWYICNKHRAIVLKSSVLISTLRDWKKPRKIIGKNKFYIEKKVKIGEDNHVNKVHVKPQFGCFHIF